MSLIQKARILALKIHVKHSNKKKLKEQQRRIWLQNPDRPLPSFKTLRKWRNRLFILSLLLILVPGTQNLLYPESLTKSPVETNMTNQELIVEAHKNDLGAIWRGFWYSSPILFGMFFIICMGFCCALDWTIYRRWGHKLCVVEW